MQLQLIVCGKRNLSNVDFLPLLKGGLQGSVPGTRWQLRIFREVVWGPGGSGLGGGVSWPHSKWLHVATIPGAEGGNSDTGTSHDALIIVFAL